MFVLGVATGLNPASQYRSLLYDNGSVPGGPDACEPSSSPSPLSFAQMFVGAWTVDADGTGTIVAKKTGLAYVALADFATMSVRKVNPTPPPMTIRQACGEVSRNPL